MKKIVFLNVFFLSIAFLFAQKTTQTSIDFNGKFIQINLNKIDHLEIKQTDDSKVSIASKQLQQEATFLTVVEDKSTLYIKEYNGVNKKSDLPACIEQPLFTSYVITIPKNVKVEISIDSGNFKAINFKGNLQLSVNNGEIELKNCNGNIQIKNIDGIIQCTTDIQNIKANSHLGKVFLKKKPISNYKKDANNLLIIETIRGNIFVNSQKTL